MGASLYALACPSFKIVSPESSETLSSTFCEVPHRTEACIPPECADTFADLALPRLMDRDGKHARRCVTSSSGCVSPGVAWQEFRTGCWSVHRDFTAQRGSRRGATHAMATTDALFSVQVSAVFTMQWVRHSAPAVSQTSLLCPDRRPAADAT